MKKKLWVIGHRGASGLVDFENTLESFQKAIDLNCDGIECDIRKTKDDVLIINHNDNIDSLLIKDYTYEELNNHTTSIGYHLPRLKEVLSLIKGKIFVDLEIKELGYENKIIEEILSILNVNEFYIRSFYDEALIKINKMNKDIRLILLTGIQKPKNLIKTRFFEVFPKRRLKKCGAIGVSPYYKELILAYSYRLKKAGYLIIPWTVNDEENMRKLINKVDGIITNYPNKLFDILNEK